MSKKKLPRGISMEDGLYRVRIFADGVQHSLGRYQSLTDAEAVLTIARSQVILGTFVPPAERRRKIKAIREKERKEAITLKQWASVWLEALSGDEDARGQTGYRGNPRSVGTIRSYRSTLEAHVFPRIGDMILKEVTPDHVEAVVDAATRQGKKHTPGAGRNVARTLRAMFNAAIAADAGGVEVNPVDPNLLKVEKTTGKGLSGRTATPEQIRELTTLMPPHLALAIPLAAWCALRQGELLGLQRGDFIALDIDGETRVKVQRQWHSKLSPPGYAPPKAGSERTIHVPASVVNMVREHLAKYVPDKATAPLFPSPQSPDRPMGQSALDRYWRAARDKVKPGLRFHDLRHTGLTFYAQQGATLRDLMERGGHTDVNSAMTYQQAVAERDRRLTAKLDEAISGEG